MRHILVTSALTYANGPLHLGHLLEYIQSDIWVRSMQLAGHQCLHIGGDDAHGTPIMLQAKKDNITPEQLVATTYKSHVKTLANFLIKLDNFHTTHSDENKALAGKIFQKLENNGDIISKNIYQAYDPEAKMFLPDRYVKGTCPKCNAENQYGDSCEVCGAHYSPTELKNSTSVVTGATPIEKESEHLFFNLEKFQELLKSWIANEHLQPEIRNKLEEWFEAGLKPWDISRDAPYFGFEIPGHPNKYFYVWLDAPIGYMASFKALCTKKGINFDAYWDKDSKYELYHFIGKDIVYFHTLFWPAMLHGSDHRMPTNVFAHGFLTINGEKMSKSRGTFITGDQYLSTLEPEYLRYYMAAKLGSGIDDIDFNFEDFVQRVNSDLVGKFVNIASRCSGFIHKYFNGKLADNIPRMTLFQTFVHAGESVQKLYEQRQYAKCMREIMNLADQANQYIDSMKPWQLVKEQQLELAHQVCTLGLNLFKVIATYLTPVLPTTAEKISTFLKLTQGLNYQSIQAPLLDHEINPYQPLLQRIELAQVKKMIEKSNMPHTETKDTPTQTKTEKNTNENKSESNTIQFEDFAKIDLRVGKVISAEAVPDADKLLKLQLDLGNGDTRQVFAGIKSQFAPEHLVGQQVVVVANLAPRKMRFGISEAMILVAKGNGPELYLLNPAKGAEPGMKIS